VLPLHVHQWYENTDVQGTQGGSKAGGVAVLHAAARIKEQLRIGFQMAVAHGPDERGVSHFEEA